jgi:hypothetical protein
MLNRYTVTYIAYPFKDSDLHFGGQVLVSAKSKLQAEKLAEQRLIDANNTILYVIGKARMREPEDVNEIH